MSFSPFASFRKYQKIWMVSVLFLCMITFVLCTGLGQGGLEDRLLSWFQSWRTGDAVAEVNGTSVYRKDLDELKQRREIANEFMRESIKITMKNTEALLEATKQKLDNPNTKEKDKDQAKIHQAELKKIMVQLEAVLIKKPRYFGSGTDLDDLLDFMLWRDRANNMDVQLVEKDVVSMFEDSVLRPVNSMNAQFYYYNNSKEVKEGKLPPAQTIHPLNFWNPRAAQEAMIKVRENYPTTDYESALESLKDEFRVQIVQFALLGSRLIDPTAGIIGKDVIEYGMEMRFPLSPYQLWKKYQADMTEFDVVMLPVKIDHFIDKTGSPTPGQLKDLFNEYKNKQYNPASDHPGFIQPEEAKIQYVTADPKSEYYKNIAKAVVTFETTPPFYYNFGLPVLGTAARMAGGIPTLEGELSEQYQKELLKAQVDYVQGKRSDLPYEQVPLTEAEFDLAMYTTARDPNAKMVAHLVGTMGTPLVQSSAAAAVLPALFSESTTAYATAAYFEHKDELQPAVKKEIERRLPIGLTLVLTAASPIKHDVLEMTKAYLLQSTQNAFLPLEAVKEEFRKNFEQRIAADQAKNVMDEVKRFLEPAQNKQNEFEARLKILQKKYGSGLTVKSSDGFVNEFTVDKNKGMNEFQKSFKDQKILDLINVIDARARTKIKLEEGDFHKLFFDSSEPFSIAAASPYMFQAWPPVLTAKNALNLQQAGQREEFGKGVPVSLWAFYADQRFLFWKTDSKEPTYPEKVSQVEPKVIEAWKRQQARKKALEYAKEVAIGLSKEQQTTGKDYMPELVKKATEVKAELITLERASYKERKFESDKQGRPLGWNYVPRELEKGLIPYPRPDMSEEVFSLYNLKKPIPYWDPVKESQKKEQEPGNDKEIDTINEKLFRKDEHRQIQLLTNRPKSIFYVTVVNKTYPAKLNDFMATYTAAKGRLQGADYFVPIARSEAAIEYREDYLKQLRAQYLKNVNRKIYEQ